MKKIINVLLSLLFCASLLAQKNSVQIVELTTEQFKQKVWDFDKSKSFSRKGDLPLILDFHATWCGPCKLLSPHLQSLQNKYRGKLIVYKIDVDNEPNLAQLFKVNALPTLVFIGSKNTFNTELGYKDAEELEKLLKKYFFKK